MSTSVRPELPTAALRSSQATHAAVDNSAPSPTGPSSTYKSGKSVQTNGATSVVPWFSDRYDAGADWRALAYWIHNHLPYSTLYFFPKLAAFNIGWHETPRRTIHSYIKPVGCLLNGEAPDDSYSSHYKGFPALRR